MLSNEKHAVTVATGTLCRRNIFVAPIGYMIIDSIMSVSNRLKYCFMTPIIRELPKMRAKGSRAQDSGILKISLENDELCCR